MTMQTTGGGGPAPSGLADVIDTYTTPEVRLDVNLSSALGAANSFAKIQREMLVPIELQGR